MAILPKQIGWSQESNLIWEILRQLDQLTKVVSTSGGGGGGTNPTSTYIPYNNAGTFADSYLVNNTTTSVLKSVYGGNDIGLKLDFANNEYSFGDINNINGGVNIQIQNSDKTIKTLFNASVFGFFGVDDGVNKFIELGDFGLFNNKTKLNIDDTIQIIKTSNQGNDIGLKLDFANSEYLIGDFTSAAGTYLSCNAAGQYIKLNSINPNIWYEDNTGYSSQIKTGYAINNIDVTGGGPYTIAVPGVYIVKFASVIDDLIFPDPNIFYGQSMCVVNTDLGVAQKISSVSGTIQNSGSGTIKSTISAGTSGIFYSDGSNWYGFSV